MNQGILALRAALSYIESLDGGVPDKTHVHLNGNGDGTRPSIDVSFFVYDQPGPEVTGLIEATGVHPRPYESDNLTSSLEHDGVGIEVSMHFMAGPDDESPVTKPKPYDRYLA